MAFITTQYSLWFLPLCLAAGFIYAFILYRKDRKLSEAPKALKTLMFSFRFLSVSIISFLLLSPFLKNIGRTVEKPIIIYAQDNSESVKSDKAVTEIFSDRIKDFFQNNPDYNFKIFTFGQDVLQTDSFTFKDKETDISQIISDIKNRFYNQNTGALILVSDGIFNKGYNPVNEIKNTNFPIYTIALGDTNIRKDLVIKEIKHNKTAFVNSKFPLQIKINADKLKGKSSEIKVYDNNTLIYNQKISITSNSFYKSYDIKIKADKPGFHKIKVVLQGVEDEINYENNKKTVIVEVTDKKQKILILSDAPHPDIAAIRGALKLNRNFETDYYSSDKFNKNINSYNLIILNNLPSKNNLRANIVSNVVKSDIPVIYMIGMQTDLNMFDNLNTGIITGAYSNAPDEVTGKLNNNFTLFDINPEVEEITLNAPPLISPFGDYKITKHNQTLFFRMVRNINTKQPLIVFFTGTGNKKTAVITGEGIWRWRIFDYKSNKNHYLFNELINSIVQFMISKESKNRFKVTCERVIPENQNIKVTAEIFDKNYKPADVKEVNFNLIDSNKQVHKFKFTKSGKKHFLNLKKLPEGDYRWTAECIFNGSKYKQEGMFTVISSNNEVLSFRANHKVLYKIAKHTSGKMFFPNDVKKLINEIKQNADIKPVSYSEKKTEALINFKLIFFIILFLLTTEWFLRKFFGSY